MLKRSTTTDTTVAQGYMVGGDSPQNVETEDTMVQSQAVGAEGISAQDHPIKLRWRVVDGSIPLRERHIRSLNPLQLPPPLIAWIRSRLEWALDNLLAAGREGVLCLAIDPRKDVVVSLEETRAQPALTVENIIELNGRVIGIVVEDEPLLGVVFCEQGGALYASAEELTTASATLAQDLATTLGFALEIAPLSRAFVGQADAAFLISDEFGYVPIELQTSSTAEAPSSAKLAECFAKVIPPISNS